MTFAMSGSEVEIVRIFGPKRRNRVTFGQRSEPTFGHWS